MADLIGEYVLLKRVGAHFKGLCPFHQEKTPSFIVSPQKGIWHCFGCHKGGDVFAFVQEIEGVDFPEALKVLAERAGVTLENRGRLRQGSGAQGRHKLFDLLKAAARFYHTLLMQHEAGRKAKEYLRERGVTEETMREFEVGYAPMQWDGVQQFLGSKGFQVEEMIQAGLAGRSQTGTYYDRFRGRIMFPITDVQGRVVAFGGRITPWQATGEEGKYVNSPETALYEKRSVVFNLSRAKAHMRHHEPCLVVEGYMDALMLWQAGLKHVVASSGTAFTAQHAALLARYTNTLHFAFDADLAGEKATTAATEAALSAGMRVATIVLPAGQDPADVAREAARAREIFQHPVSLTAVLLKRLAQETQSGKREEQLAVLLPFIRRVRNLVLQGEMVREIATVLALPESEVVKLVGRPPVQRASLDSSALAAPEDSGRPLLVEHELLGLLIVSPPARQAVWGELTPDLFVDPGSQDLYNTMHTLAEHHLMEWPTIDEEALVALLPPALQSLARALAVEGEERLSHALEGADAEARALLRAQRRQRLRARLDEMQRELAHTSPTAREAVLQQFQKLAEELAHV